MSALALRLEGVEKRFGAVRALDGLGFSLPRGSITGLIGPNGAGKTTCFGVIAGLLTPDAGRVEVFGGGPFEPQESSGRLGLLPQDCELPPHTHVETYLRYLARLQGASVRQAAKLTDEVLDEVALGDRRSSRMAELSHGMRRRVAVAQALLGQPELILLDEPTSGLDPQLVAQMRELLQRHRARGASLLVSSHVLVELEAVCDHVVFMQRGRVTRSGSLAEVTGRQRIVYFRLARRPSLEALRAHLPELEARYEGELLRVSLPADAEPSVHNDRVIAALLAESAGVLELRPGESLERAYLDAD
ncbi:MAG: ABC transporter ATP-binding protein [Myxococcales bacterium]|nr:ABC transporter ATP-binding protein [Myxococcales bacterium]